MWGGAMLEEALGRLSRPSRWHLGWSLLLTWVFCVFYFRSADVPGGDARTVSVDSSLMSDLIHAGAPLAVSVVTLIVIALLERRIRVLVDRRCVLFLCPALVTIGTVCILLPTEGIVGEALFWVGTLLSGIGSGPLWIMWGELYSRLEQGVSETTATMAAVLAMAVALVCVSLTGWMAVAVVSMLPLASGLLLLRARRVDTGTFFADADGEAREDFSWASGRHAQLEGAHERARQNPLVSLRAFGREDLGILIASAVICHAGSFLPQDAGLGICQVAIVFAAVLGLVIAAVGILTPRRFNLQFLYRWMCPYVIACLACLVWFPGSLGGEVAFVGSIGARLAFCLLTQVYFARIAGEGHFTPLQAFGLGWISLHLGDLAGVMFNVCTMHLAPLFSSSASCILMLTLTLVVVVMFALNGERTFVSPDVSVASSTARGSAAAGEYVASAVSPVAASANLTHAGGISDTSFAGSNAGSESPGIEGRVAELSAQCGLTAREHEVLILLAQGRSNPYIRDALSISLDTAGTHVKHVYAKLGVHSRQELIDLVREHEG